MRRPGLIDQLSEFSGALRNRGLTVTSDQTADMARAMTLVDLSRRSQAQAALRSLTVTDPGQIPVFDEEFEIFFDRILPPRIVNRNPDAPDFSEHRLLPLEASGEAPRSTWPTRAGLGGRASRQPRLRRPR